MPMPFNLNKAVQDQFGKRDALDPRTATMFDKALKSSEPNLIRKFLGREVKPILVLECELSNRASVGNRHYAGSQVVAVADIHGTLERDGDFSYDFAPLRQTSELRWRKVATAMLNGVDLPPIELVQVGDEYFVKDGHHRISAARALGFGYLDAIVEVWG